MNWNKIKEEGFYIRQSSGTFKDKPHTSYAICKDEAEGTRTLRCYVNLCAARILQQEKGFELKKDDNQTVWLNRCPSMDFTTQAKEPLKITFH